ncbi:hypothetical protein EUTSA_v10003093mg [Eutrema salsugineum]|uniref:Ubiquitin-like protease family profile domain-containing protein n=1 Tax=Eutrema salsugineum TaxID=72664 RepID=V4L4U8_EUTSA|nr:hypothetical protein EUTSA_v10003093mg [Eutrema salsugineum]
MIGQTPAVGDTENAVLQRFEKAMKAFKRPLTCVDGTMLTSKDISEMVGRQKSMPAKVMDSLCMLGRHLLRDDSRKPRLDVLDTKFVSMLTKLYPKFSRTDNRADFKFSKAVIDKIEGRGEVDRHWVFLAVDLSSRKIQIINCNANLRTDASMKTEIRPIAEMLPYLFRQVAANDEMSQVASTQYEIARVADVPQVNSTHDAGLVAYFLMLSHAIFGMEGSTDFDLTHIDLEAKKVATVGSYLYLC